jgi:AcrR family transcriptional regulator
LFQLKPTVKPKRRYDSTRRREQATETRRRILDAARGLFTAQGWNGTTMDAIAREAGVAVETVYAAFGSKLGIIRPLIGIALRGDDAPTPLLEREKPKAALGETDPRRQLGMFALDIGVRLGRVAPLLEVVRTAGATEPEMAVLFRELHAARLENLTAFVRAVSRNGPLRPGLDESAAAETVWALASPELYRLLTETRGWSGEAYARWLADSLVALLLPPARDRKSVV